MIHHIFANKSNIGDWLSALGIQSLLAPLEIIEHLCDESFVDETLAHLSTVSRNDLVIIGGGGLFMDYFVPFWEKFLEIANHVSFCIWGVGYCDLKREDTRPPKTLLEEIVAKSRLCIVRDELTRSLLGRSELPPAVPCPSICAVHAPKRCGRGLLHLDSYDVVGSEVYEAMCVHAEAFAIETGRTYQTSNNLIPAGSRRALRLTLERYTSADLVLSSRLHGCIIGLASGCKVLAVSGDHKVESFMTAAGLSDWVCDISAIDSLPYYLSNLPDQRSIHNFVEWACDENRSVAEQVKIAMET